MILIGDYIYLFINVWPDAKSIGGDVEIENARTVFIVVSTIALVLIVLIDVYFIIIARRYRAELQDVIQVVNNQVELSH